MSWLRWLKGRREDPALLEWRREWATAVEAPDRQRAEALRARLSLSGAQQRDDDDELEREMLEGLESLLALMDERRRIPHCTALGPACEHIDLRR